jgi:hypothetical protein
MLTESLTPPPVGPTTRIHFLPETRRFLTCRRGFAGISSGRRPPHRERGGGANARLGMDHHHCGRRRDRPGTRVDGGSQAAHGRTAEALRTRIRARRRDAPGQEGGRGGAAWPPEAARAARDPTARSRGARPLPGVVARRAGPVRRRSRGRRARGGRAGHAADAGARVSDGRLRDARGRHLGRRSARRRELPRGAPHLAGERGRWRDHRRAAPRNGPLPRAVRGAARDA